MLFILILIVFSFIIFISLYGDYETKEKKKDYEKMEEILDVENKR